MMPGRMLVACWIPIVVGLNALMWTACSDRAPDPDGPAIRGPGYGVQGQYQAEDLAQCRQGDFTPIWGDLHSHTSHSDGTGEPGPAFDAARNAGLHFLAITDHVQLLDATEWSHCTSIANDRNAPGSFVAFCGFEVEPNKGHSNVFWTQGDFWTAANRDDYAAKIDSYPDSVGQINHPCTDVVDNRWEGFAYRAAIDDNMALMEFSGAGDFACKRGWFTTYLDAGWHFAPSANSDYHGGWSSWPADEIHRSGFWVDDLSRDGIKNAMRQRRSFSATPGAWIRLKADNCWMGSVIGGVSSASFVVDAVAAGLDSIVLVGNGNADRHSCACGGQGACTCSVQLGVGDGSYVFAFATRSSGPNLVSSPVWFRAAPTCAGECAPGQSASQGCGNCGTQTRRCQGNCAWSPWSDCGAQGACAAGQNDTAPCNQCGTMTRPCQADCSWAGWSACSGAGQTESTGCNECGQMTRVCQPDGNWNAWSVCQGNGQTESNACNECGHTTRQCQPDGAWSAWSACEGSGSESLPCGTCGQSTRECRPDGTWNPWSACKGTGMTESSPCGNCGQMTRVCQLDGNYTGFSQCEGSGPCAPGQLESEPCCDCGTRERTCQSDCQWPEWSACSGPDPAGGTQACNTGLGGACEPGISRCVNGCLGCVNTWPGEPETCDGVDNDCNARVDDGDPQVMGAQPPPFAATLKDASYPLTIVPGESSPAWAEFENVGSETWMPRELWLETDSTDQASKLRDDATWPAYHVASVLGREVKPGERARFEFAIRIDTSTQSPVSETFRLAVAGQKLMCPAPVVSVSVRPARERAAGSDRTDAFRSSEDGGCGCRHSGSRRGAGSLLLALAVSLLRLRNSPRRR